jgi:hypothetical protein
MEKRKNENTFFDPMSVAFEFIASFYAPANRISPWTFWS